MKVIAILICPFLFISSIHAQNTQSKQDLKRLSYGVSFAPEINYRVLRSNDSSENWLKEERDNQFIGYDRFNLYGNSGIGAEFYLTNNIKIRGLFQYKQALKSTNTQLAIGEYLQSFGIDFSVLWTPFVKKYID